jgi:hypothetical protein
MSNVSLRQSQRALFLVLCLSGFISFNHAADAAANIVSQPPCTSGSGYCLQFQAGNPIPVIRSINFNAPSAGKAAVTFHGSMVCSNGSVTDKVVDFATQIVFRSTDTPVVDGPGGMRQAIVLKDSSDHTFNTTDSLNLASTRYVTFTAAGRRTFYFKIVPLRMDASTSCVVYNAAFTVLFLP